MSTVYILQRADDLIVLGVRWSGLDLSDGTLHAPALGGTLTLLFPPQHIAEQVDAVGSDPEQIDGIPVWRSRLAAASTVTFGVPMDAAIPLTVEGVLDAARTSFYLREQTVIELPWRLHIAPGTAQWRHASRPLTSPRGVVGLWITRAADPASTVELFAVDDGAAQTPDPFPIPLTMADRTIIAAEGSITPAHSRRLELSTIGGSLSAVGRWPSFDWEHEAALGRDVYVHTVARVRMYPFNHLAELSSVSRRVFDAATGIAALRKTTTLTFIEPVVSPPETKEFPFTQVEVLVATYPDLPEQQWQFFTRGSGILAELEASFGTMDFRRSELQPFVAAEMTRDRSVEELAFSMPQAQRLLEVWPVIAAIDAELGPGEQAWADAGPIQDQIDQLSRQIQDLENQPFGPDGFPDPAVSQMISELSAQISNLNSMLVGLPSLARLQQLRDQRAPLAAEADANWAVVEPETTRDRSFEELVNVLPEAAELQQLNAAIADLEAQIAAERAESERQHPWYFVPRDANAVIRFPVRLRGPAGDVNATIPMVAVREFELPPSGSMAGFSSLTDPQTVQGIEQEWTAAGASEVPIAPTRIDLVRSPAPAPGDTRVVHALQIAGAVSDAVADAAGVAGYLPRLLAFDIELPEVSTLLSDIAPTRYKYAQEFLEGAAADVVFQTIGEPIDLSFIDNARNSGALLSPRILADGLSRELGPVNIDGIRSEAEGLFDASKIFADGATLLGFDLATLVKQLSEPPAIVTDLIDGKAPVVSMTWKNVRIHSSGPLVATDDTRLDLEMKSGPEGSSITCTVRSFALALPLPEHELLRLSFDEVAYTQKPGEGPDLGLKGLAAEFRNELKLLESLQDAVSLGDTGPSIQATPSGITAKYSLPIPPVTAGAFQLKDIVFHAGVEVPFGAEPPSVTIGFASRERPFLATVLMFGGGGYVDIALDHTGIRRIEAAIEFGASIGFDFFIAEAEVHVLGGIRYTQEGSAIAVSGYLRIGGCVQVLGLVSLSIELLVALAYDSGTNALVGRATLVIELDLTLYSTSVELDSGPWTIAGGDAPPDDQGALGAGASPDSVRNGGVPAEADPDVFLEQWRAYREAFA